MKLHTWTSGRQTMSLSKSIVLFMTIMLTGGVLLTACGGSKNSEEGSSPSSAESGGKESGSSKSSEPMQVLWVGDSSGPTKSIGTMQLLGLEAGMHYWNEHGGFDGREAQLTKLDDNGEAATAVSETIKYLSSHPAPTYVWAGSEGDQIAAMIPEMTKAGLLSGAVNDGNLQCIKNASTTCPTFFTTGGPPQTTAETYAEWFKGKGYKKVGILQESLAFTESETPSTEEALKKAGISYVETSFPESSVDLSPELSKLKGAGVEAVLAEALGPASGYTLAGRASVGWNVPVVFDIAGSSNDITKLAKPGDLSNAYETVGSPTNGSLSLPGVKLMVENAKPYGGIPNEPLYVAAFGWDSMLTLHNAMEQAKSTEAKAVAEVMNELPESAQNDPLLTLTKKICYSPENHQNNCYTSSDFQVVPVGPLVGGQVHPKS